MVPGRARAFRFFAFLLLRVMTISYILYSHDVMFYNEHCYCWPGLSGGRGEIEVTVSSNEAQHIPI